MLTGGTPQTNADLMAALADRYEPWVLRCDTRTIELLQWTEAGLVAIETHPLERPIHASVHRSSEYDGRVADLLVRFGFELVHIRHFAWQGLGLSAVCKRLGVPVVLSFHDFYTVCPTTKLLDNELRYCGGACTPGEGRCVPELWAEGSLPPLKHRFVHRWREMMAGAIAACDAFVTTSPGARDVLARNFPFLAERDFRVIPHARDFVMEPLAVPLEPGEPLRVLIPGNISPAKGSELIQAVADLDWFGQVELHILGDSGTIAAGPNVILHGRYRRSEFDDAVRRIRPHLGAIFSIWPETYSHTLTEMWAAGLPVIALDMGAVGERIGDAGGGWLIDPATGAEELLDELIRLKGEPDEIGTRVDEVLAWQRGTGRGYDTVAMAAQYDRLYRGLRARSRAFAASAPRAPIVLTLADPAGPEGLGDQLRNRAGRPVILRPAPAGFSWLEAPLDGVDAVLVEAAALPEEQIAAIVGRCARGGLPLVVDAGALESGEIDGARLALLAGATLVLARTPAQAAALDALGIAATAVDQRLGGRAWRARAQARPSAAADSCEVLIVADDPMAWGALEPIIEALATAESAPSVTLRSSATPGWAQAAAPVESVLHDHVDAIAAIAREHDLVLLFGSDRARLARLALEFRAAGAAVVEQITDRMDADALIATLVVLLADPLARDRLIDSGRQAALTHLARHGDEALDAALLEHFRRRSEMSDESVATPGVRQRAYV
ncbi:MAG: glycosyltransferase [Sphingomonas sp.]